jgi:hypothetical protein
MKFGSEEKEKWKEIHKTRQQDIDVKIETR